MHTIRGFMKNIYRQLIDYLEKQDTPIKADNLALVLNVSVRSIKNYISDINKIYPNLISSSRNGYKLNNNHSIKPQNNNVLSIQDRIKYTITTLLQQIDGIDIDDLADELFVSTSTLKNYLIKVKRQDRKSVV